MSGAQAADTRPVLVVDDDMVSRLVLAHMVRRLGFEVFEADDVPPAMALLQHEAFALVMSDFSMPGGTGLDLFEHVRGLADPPPFVLVTGIVDDVGVSSKRVGTVDACLTKPVSTRSLKACIDQVLPGRRSSAS